MPSPQSNRKKSVGRIYNNIPLTLRYLVDIIDDVPRKMIFGSKFKIFLGLSFILNSSSWLGYFLIDYFSFDTRLSVI